MLSLPYTAATENRDDLGRRVCGGSWLMWCSRWVDLCACLCCLVHVSAVSRSSKRFLLPWCILSFQAGPFSVSRSHKGQASLKLSSVLRGLWCDPALGSWLPPTCLVAYVPQAELLCWGECWVFPHIPAEKQTPRVTWTSV